MARDEPGCLYTIWYTILCILCLAPEREQYGAPDRRREADDMGQY